LAATVKRTTPFPLPPAPPVISIQLSVLSALHWQPAGVVTTGHVPPPRPAGKLGGSAPATVYPHAPGGGSVVVVGASVVTAAPAPPLPAMAMPATAAPPARARGKVGTRRFGRLSEAAAALL